ncbi:LysR family transcriptional regulator [Glaciecola sp. XM2]|uniref:LysR family transcriptional regulator n=1 Tax=Glaciecola sp. XM2 TaxID=1914931 RepID=UPI001BDE9C6B|nr:LysR family transcriptional regulator [Glaciecola sp. XM2]MBT1451869.1 LysR family transcriptional regulator [Glaciecola sp. XM2]
MRPHELNLLIIFDAIMTEGSISRAADRLSMTQPAVSNAVSRMRVAWKDELFVKAGRNIKPTLKAENMWAQVKQPISDLSGFIRPSDFTPATAQRTFRIALADIVAQMLMVPLRKRIEALAPGINIHLVPYTIVNTVEVLESANVDLVIGAASLTPGSVRSEFLFQPTYACAMRKGHTLAKKNITLEEFAAADHLLVSLSGDTFGFTDEVLAQQGLTRRIAATVNQFSLLGPMLEQSNLIAVAPLGAISKDLQEGRITATHSPVKIPPTTANMYWHKRQDKDPGLMWLKEQTKEIIVASDQESIHKALPFFCQADPTEGVDGAHI